jgi:hypothetical protein
MAAGSPTAGKIKPLIDSSSFPLARGLRTPMPAWNPAQHIGKIVLDGLTRQGVNLPAAPRLASASAGIPLPLPARTAYNRAGHPVRAPKSALNVGELTSNARDQQSGDRFAAR